MTDLRGALRIYAPSAKPPAEGRVPAMENELPSGKKGDPYFARLVLLIPSEVIALYLTFKEVAASFLGIWAVICLLLVVFARSFATYKKGKSIQVGSVLIAVVSFVLWIYATGGYFFNWKLSAEYPGVISVAIGVWTFVIPYFYKGDSSNS